MNNSAVDTFFHDLAQIKAKNDQSVPPIDVGKLVKERGSVSAFARKAIMSRFRLGKIIKKKICLYLIEFIQICCTSELLYKDIVQFFAESFPLFVIFIEESMKRGRAISLDELNLIAHERGVKPLGFDKDDGD